MPTNPTCADCRLSFSSVVVYAHHLRWCAGDLCATCKSRPATINYGAKLVCDICEGLDQQSFVLRCLRAEIAQLVREIEAIAKTHENRYRLGSLNQRKVNLEKCLRYVEEGRAWEWPDRARVRPEVTQ
jgi:hypothetical protein